MSLHSTIPFLCGSLNDVVTSIVSRFTKTEEVSPTEFDISE